jgi:hypothetical protein
MIKVGRFVRAGALCLLLGAGPVLAQGHGEGGGRVDADGGSYGRGHAYAYGGYPERINASGAYWRGGYWHGGHWSGAFWPAVSYGAGFAWFLPVLPNGYATYSYGGVPYYYANHVYYTWDASYGGYVATDPPPVSGGSAAQPAADGAAPPRSPPQATASAPSGGQLFIYPKNGQTDEQQSTDRRECQEWAASQAGQSGPQAPDYRLAMEACVEARGYSVQ